MRLFMLAVVCLLSPLCAAQFTPIGALPGEAGTEAVNISRDGTTVIGMSVTTTGTRHRAWTWRRHAGTVELPLGRDVEVTSISYDGRVVVGRRRMGDDYEVVRLVEGQPSQVLAGVSGYYPPVVSGDGDVVFGNSVPGDQTSRAVRWKAGVVEVLPLGPRPTGIMTQPGSTIPPVLPCGTGFGDTTPQSVTASSFDGTAVVGGAYYLGTPYCDGHVYQPYGINTSFFWRQGTGVVWIRTQNGRPVSGAGPYDGNNALRTLLIYDGSAIRIARDLVPGAIVTIPPTSPGRVSEDGRRAAMGASLWDMGIGGRTLQQVFAPIGGSSAAEWSNLRVAGLSASGLILCGTGADPHGTTQAWFADVSVCGPGDFDHDGDVATDHDIEAFFECLAGSCCDRCDSLDVDRNGTSGDAFDLARFFEVLGHGGC